MLFIKKTNNNFITLFKNWSLTQTLKIAAFIMIFPLFFVIMSFANAVTPEQAALKDGPLMPSTWEAGVMNHGEYYQWYTISKHPVFFGFCLSLFVGLYLFLITTIILAIKKGKLKWEIKGARWVLRRGGK